MSIERRSEEVAPFGWVANLDLGIVVPASEGETRATYATKREALWAIKRDIEGKIAGLVSDLAGIISEIGAEEAR